MASAKRKQTVVEEVINGVTHGLGAVASIVGLIFLLIVAISEDDALKIFCAIVYGSSMIALYLASTLYHSIPMEKVKEVLRRIDICAIFLLIAGTYTPFVLISLGGALGNTLFFVVWGLAIGGIVLNIWYIKSFERWSFIYYLALGWICVFAIKPMLETMSFTGLSLLFIGGVLYSVGVVFLKSQKKFMHMIWHFFVIGGSACHYFAILYFVM